MKCKLPVFFILFLLGINVFVLIKFRQYIKRTTLYINVLQNNPDELNALKLNTEVAIENSNIQLENVMVTDSKNAQKPLRSFFKSGQSKFLVCRFSDMHCESCVEYAIKATLQWSDSIGENNILFLGTHRNRKIFSKQIKAYGIDKFTTVNVSSLNLPAEELCFPYYFVLDSTLTVLNVSIPDKGVRNVDHRYFQKIQKKFFKL